MTFSRLCFCLCVLCLCRVNRQRCTGLPWWGKLTSSERWSGRDVHWKDRTRFHFKSSSHVHIRNFLSGRVALTLQDWTVMGMLRFSVKTWRRNRKEPPACLCTTVDAKKSKRKKTVAAFDTAAALLLQLLMRRCCCCCCSFWGCCCFAALLLLLLQLLQLCCSAHLHVPPLLMT